MEFWILEILPKLETELYTLSNFLMNVEYKISNQGV